MLRIATVNVNGIRAAVRRGFVEWLSGVDADVVTLQEVRCPEEAIPAEAREGWHWTYDEGDRKGRNGTAVMTRVPPTAARTWADGPVARGMRAFAAEGRFVEVDLADAPLTVASLYVPKGGLPAHLQVPGRMREAPDGGARFDRKMRFLDSLSRQLTRARRDAARRGREYLVTGDFNVAHTWLDVAAWRAAQKAEGFLPEERAWFEQVTGPRTLVDVVRRLHPDTPGPYTWWSWLGTTYPEDRGWRIDHHLASPRLARTARVATVHRETGPQRLSDHAPVVVDYDLSLLPSAAEESA